MIIQWGENSNEKENIKKISYKELMELNREDKYKGNEAVIKQYGNYVFMPGFIEKL